MVTYLLQTHKAQWNNKLAKRVVKLIQDWIAGTESIRWNGDQYKSILQNGAYRIKPEIFTELQSGWPSYAPLWGIWQKEVETFMQVFIVQKRDE